MSRETSLGLTDIGDTLHDRLARAGLVEPRSAVEVTKLGVFIDACIAGRVEVKPRTLINLK